jgi:hypothetical protein
MSVFAVISPSPSAPLLESAITTKFADAHYELGNGVWLVAGAGSAIEVSEKLGITPNTESSSAIVLEAASYYGRANPAVWSWIKSQWEGGANG